MNQIDRSAPRDSNWISEDIRDLLQQAPNLKNYHEINQRNQAEEILQRWPLLALVSPGMAIPPSASAIQEERANVILVTGIAGGVGATTVAANLASALSRQGGQVAAVDLSAGQDLHFHLSREEKPAGSGGMESVVEILPEPDNHISTQNDEQSVEPRLSVCLSSISLDSYDWIVIDCPWSAQAAFGQACSLAGRIVLVTSAEPAAAARTGSALTSMLPALQTSAVQSHLLINRFNPAVTLQRDIHAWLHGAPPLDLAPVEIPYDSRIADGLAQCRSILSFAPDCEAAQCFRTIGSWIANQAIRQEETGL